MERSLEGPAAGRERGRAGAGRRKRGAVAVVAVALAWLAFAAPAAALGPDDLKLVERARLNPRLVELTLTTPALAEPTKVRVLWPRGYPRRPGKRYPVLYLLHGGLGSFRDWTEAGDAQALTETLDLIVVMPDTGPLQGYTDWYNAGRFGPPRWETYHLDQLVPWIDARYRTVGGRGARALAGLSMGGGGALTYAAKRPDLFAHTAGFSPAADLTHPGVIALNELGPTAPDGSRSPGYGPFATQEVRWRGQNPVDLAENLRPVEVSVRTGNGQPGGEFGGPLVDPIEVACHQMASTFHARLDHFGIEHLWEDYGPGSHTWPYWRRDLRLELPRIMATFADPPKRPRAFAYNSVANRYRAFRWRVRLDRPVVEFSRLAVRGPRRFALSGSGSATVRTPPQFAPRRRYRVILRNRAARVRRTVRANRRGALRLAVDLGPPNEFQQFTPEARAAGTNVFTTRVRIRGAR